ncbi:hypothetical protein AMTR_s00030p00111560 [Amborella trichopoda]|uniref:Uncharacterized protein n=1 Tax=Amborella trichopoda TaxID=13333 RepID=U5CS57_AMBTC|nr:hypothetical protein AMTR_s00030p00111560 [Amborella trichopoda]
MLYRVQILYIIRLPRLFPHCLKNGLPRLFPQHLRMQRHKIISAIHEQKDNFVGHHNKILNEDSLGADQQEAYTGNATCTYSYASPIMSYEDLARRGSTRD